MKRLSVAAVVLTFAAALAVAPGCQKAEEAKPEVKSAPKAAEKPATAPKPAQQSGSQVAKETLDSCLKGNPDNSDYCHCYSKEVGSRYDEKSKSGEVSAQERGQIAVQSALACKKTK